MAVEQFDGKIEVRNTAGTGVCLTLNGDSGNITAGGAGSDGDLVLRSSDFNPVNRIHLDAGKGNIWVGGSGADGDIVLFPRRATHSENAGEATIHLDGDQGGIKLTGAIHPQRSPSNDSFTGRYSVNNGAVAHFQGTHRSGSIDYTHVHPPARRERENLMLVRIFNSLLHSQSLVLVTPHTSTVCTHFVGELSRPAVDIPGVGPFVGLQFMPTLEPGTRIRIVYWILN